MVSFHSISRADMALIPSILKFTSPDNIPLEFRLGDRTVRGIPQDFSPKTSYRLTTCNTLEYVIDGTNADGLNIRAEYIEYRDFPVTEWVVYITNNGEKDTPVISNVRLGGKIYCPSPVLEYGNGDTLAPDGYHFFKNDLTSNFSLSPTTGTSCQGAFPYMTLHGEDREIRLAIGWPTKWSLDIYAEGDNVIFSCGQARCNTVLHVGETYRTPRLNLMAYTSDGNIYRGINIWRSWYFKHILPRENGQPIPPKLCLHNFQADGKPEFTGATEQNQIFALNEYIRRGMKPDIWWVDAGWYLCDYDWTRTGTWYPDPERFPNGLAPLGKVCEENGVQLMLWFEPERVRAGEEISREHPEWVLLNKSDGDGLLNLANKDALNWLIEHVDRLIKDSHIAIYRQDFNFDPAPIWENNEAPDRIGIIENLHAQGYLKYWDELILRNPGLWIDSCASGGRRNDLETMRRAVTLHYTDVGYGNHPTKQKQHREMFEWIPYFRAHNMSWDMPDGTYDGGNNAPVEFDFHCALAPALTSMYTYNDSEEHFEIGRKMDNIWREAAELELSGDYYPITECNRDPHDWYAMQFDNIKERKGFAQVIRNTLVEEASFLLTLPCIHEDMTYTFTDRETQNSLTITSEELAKGLKISLPKRRGQILFYEFS